MNTHQRLSQQIRNSRALYVMLPLFCLAIIAAIWMWAYHAEGALREDEVDDLQIAADFTFNYYREHTFRVLHDLDRSTLAIKMAIERDLAAALPSSIVNRPDLTEIPGALLVAYIDAKGSVLHCTTNCDYRSVPDREYFAYHRGHRNDDIRISRPELSRTLGRWVIHVTRRINDDHGNFAGVLLAALDLYYLVEEPPNSLLKPWGTYTIATKDGITLAQRRQDEVSFGDRFVSPVAFESKEYTSAIKRITTNAAGRPDRLATVATLREFPIVVAVSVNLEQALRYLDSRRMSRYTPAAALSLFVLFGMAVIMRLFHQLHARLQLATQSELTYNAVINGTIDAFCTLAYLPAENLSHRDFVFLNANGQMERIVAVEAKALVGRSLRTILPDLVTDAFIARCLASMKSGEPFHNSVEVKNAAHSTLSLYYQVIPVEGGIALALRDLTESNRIIVEHRQNRRFMQTMIDSIPALVHVVGLGENDRGNIIVWNKTCEAVTGYHAGGVLNRNIHHVLDSKTAAMMEQVLQEIETSSTPIERKEHRVITRDGAARYMDSTFVPITDEHGQFRCVLGISIDITNTRKNRIASQTLDSVIQASSDLLPNAIFFDDINGKRLFANRMFTEMIGAQGERPGNSEWADNVHLADRDDIEIARLRMRLTGHKQTVRARYVQDDGGIIDATVYLNPVYVDNEMQGCLGIVLPDSCATPGDGAHLPRNVLA